MTKAELLGDLNARISAAKVSGFWTDAAKITWLDAAGQRVCDFYRWPFLELALTTQSRDSKEYYDYPTDEGNRLKPNSIYNIIIEGETYAKGMDGRRRVTWAMFQKKKNESDDELVFANHNGFWFLHTVPEDGLEISIYGLKGWQKLANMDDDTEPITPAEVDEAIVRLALAACLRKAKKYQEARAETVEVLDPAVGLLANLKMQIEAEAPQGYGGRAENSRWSRG